MDPILDRWHHEDTGAVSCEIDPVGRSADNLCLFTCEAYALGLVTKEECEKVLLAFEDEPGILARYPGHKDWCSWDDHTAASAVSQLLASRMYDYMTTHKWSTPADKLLWRFPIFIPTVIAGSGRYLMPWWQVLIALAYIANMFEPKTETSGKIILWLAQKNLQRFYLLRLVTFVWRKVLQSKHPGGIKEVMQIYFPPKKGIPHPFGEVAPTHFEVF